MRAPEAAVWYTLAILVMALVASKISGVSIELGSNTTRANTSLYMEELVIDSETMLYHMKSLPVTVNETALLDPEALCIFVSKWTPPGNNTTAGDATAGGDAGAGEGNTTPLWQAILRVLSLNATQVTPEAYWMVASLAGILNATATGNVSYTTAVTQEYNITIYEQTYKALNVTPVNITLPLFNAEKYIVSYPPSARVVAGPVNYTIASVYNVTAHVRVAIILTRSYLAAETQEWIGNTTVVENRYYATDVYGEAVLYANGEPVSGAVEFFKFTVPWSGYTHSGWLAGTVTVPPGVEKTVYAGYSIIYSGRVYTYSYMDSSGVWHIVNIYYPDKPVIVQDNYTFTWYEYAVTIPLNITVYNGTEPVTVVETPDGALNYTGWSVLANYSYRVWSTLESLPTINISVTVYDVIDVYGYNITRVWRAGNLSVKPESVVETVGRLVNNTLRFLLEQRFEEPPPWVFSHAPQREVYRTNRADRFVNGPAYYYALAMTLLEKGYDEYGVYDIMRGIQSGLLVTNNTWRYPVDVLRYRNGTLLLVSLQSMPVMFVANYTNITRGNASVFIAAFYRGVPHIVVRNETVRLYGVVLGYDTSNATLNTTVGGETLALQGLAALNETLVNGTYTFHRWVNYSSPPVCFVSTPVADYEVLFYYTPELPDVQAVGARRGEEEPEVQIVWYP